MHSTGILLVALSIAIAALATIFSASPSILLSQAILKFILATALASQFLQLHLSSPGIFISASDANWRLFSALLACATFLSGCSLSTSARMGRPCFLLSGFAFLFIAFWVIRFSPDPQIDVFDFQVRAGEALLAGTTPYGIRPPNIYLSDQFYGPAVVKDGILQFGYPYFPFSLLAVIPGLLLGDPRLAQIVFIAATGFMFAFLQPGPLGRGIALLYWFSPRTLFVVEQSWTEPLLVFLGALTAIASKFFPSAKAPVFGLLLAAKQTMVWMPFLSFLLFQGPMRSRLHSLVVSFLVAGTITIPFALWNPVEFWRSVVEWQFIQPFRHDSLSFAPLFVLKAGTSYPMLLPFTASLACIGIVWWRSQRSPAGWAISSCFVYLVFFALNKQAFCNYYFMVIGFACVAASSATLSKKHTNST